MIIGDYGYSIIDIKTAKLLDINVLEVLELYGIDNNIYYNLFNLIKEKAIDIYQYDKIILLDSSKMSRFTLLSFSSHFFMRTLLSSKT